MPMVNTAAEAMETTISCKFIDCKKTVICTLTTSSHLSFISKLLNFLARKSSRFKSLFKIISGNKSCTEGTHDTCDIRTNYVNTSCLFKGTKNSIVVESTTLNYDILSEL